MATFMRHIIVFFKALLSLFFLPLALSGLLLSPHEHNLTPSLSRGTPTHVQTGIVSQKSLSHIIANLNICALGATKTNRKKIR